MIYHLRNDHPFIQSHNPWFPSHESSHPKVANVSYKDPNNRNILHSGEAVAKQKPFQEKVKHLQVGQFGEQITSADRFLFKYIHRNMQIIKYTLVFLIICIAYPIISIYVSISCPFQNQVFMIFWGVKLGGPQFSFPHSPHKSSQLPVFMAVPIAEEAHQAAT